MRVRGGEETQRKGGVELMCSCLRVVCGRVWSLMLIGGGC